MKRFAILVVFLSAVPLFAETAPVTPTHGNQVTSSSKPTSVKSVEKSPTSAVSKAIGMCVQRPGTVTKR